MNFESGIERIGLDVSHCGIVRDGGICRVVEIPVGPPSFILSPDGSDRLVRAADDVTTDNLIAPGGALYDVSP